MSDSDQSAGGRKRRLLEEAPSERETRPRVCSGNGIVGDFDGGFGGNGCFNGVLEDGEGFKGDLDATGDAEKGDDVDVNSDFDLNLHVENASSDEVGVNDLKRGDDCLEGILKVMESIDLNLDANPFVEEDNGTANCCVEQATNRDCEFDLNLGIGDGTKDGVRDDDVCDGQEQPGSPLKCQHLQPVDGADSGELKEVHLSLGSSFGNGMIDGVRKEDGVLNGDTDHRAGTEQMDGLTEVAISVVDGFDLLGSQQLAGRRKRRKVIDNSESLEKMVLRRSARKGSAASARNHVSSMVTHTEDDLLASPVNKLILEENQFVSSHKAPEEPADPCPKLHLPPSSKNINLARDTVLDVFNVYACLRAFSTLLFLSPFELEDFVASLECLSPTPLFDSIHVSVLQILRKHLEYLSSEASEPAAECLRTLNWNLLDSITWPNFMAEYLLFFGSGLKSEIDLFGLKLFRSDYYKQPVNVKVEILRCLCEDIMETELIKSELNRRSLVCEYDLDFDRNVHMEHGKKRKTSADVSSGSCLTEDLVDETKDGNSDECCLCKMDGSLICCDGCPAAYHSKCVGVVNTHLPEGDWFCPECAIERCKPWVRFRNALRGAEPLGTDPYGLSYFNSCGYLLVLDSSDAEYSVNYYNRDDLIVVRDVLKAAGVSYGSILKAIDEHWNISAGSNKASRILDTVNSPCFNLPVEGHHYGLDVALQREASSDMSRLKVEDIDGGKLFNTFVAENSDPLDIDGPNSVQLHPPMLLAEFPCTSSEGSAEITYITSDVHNHRKQGSAGFSDQSLTCRKSLRMEGVKYEKFSCAAEPFVNAVSVSKIHARIAYTNYYSFAPTASSTVKELAGKASEQKKEEPLKSEEEVILMQMKAILKSSEMFNMQNTRVVNKDVQRERCGWCLACRTSTGEMDCLFNLCQGPVHKVLKDKVVTLETKLNGSGHLADLISLILSFESRLCGLLLGPWRNPQHFRLFHSSFYKEADIRSVKDHLLLLEANLHRLAVSPDWFEYVDSAVTIGSAVHIVTAFRSSIKNGIARRKGRCFDNEINPASSVARGLGICWWRGGWLSRQLFCWKVLPRCLIRKAARQAGRKKIPGIFYSDGSDGTKRSKRMAWQAAVESSTTVEQLALQVRELDLNIRWDEIENRCSLLALDKEFKKSIRLFKKCVIRRKALEEGSVKYLLDFGKRRIIPDVVKKHGIVVEEPSSERRKFWLDESHVPLHLLKGFEEKRVARKSDKVVFEKSCEVATAKTKSHNKRGFSYLFSKAEKPEYIVCGHCRKDVRFREAVCCELCKGYFHKRHAKKSPGAMAAECTYTCHQCRSGKSKVELRTGKNEKKKGKSGTRRVKQHSQKSEKPSTSVKQMQLEDSKKVKTLRWSLRLQKDKKVSAVVPLRRSLRKIKYVSVQAKKPKGKRGRPRKKQKPKPNSKTADRTSEVLSLKKTRTKTCHSFWLNGLHLSGKRDDARVIQFHKNLYTPSDDLTVSSACPKCLLCSDTGRISKATYIACEICEEWFHGDAYGLNATNQIQLIGFRCHICRESSVPVCPHVDSVYKIKNKLDVSCDSIFSKQVSPVIDGVLLPFEISELFKQLFEEAPKTFNNGWSNLIYRKYWNHAPIKVCIAIQLSINSAYFCQASG